MNQRLVKVPFNVETARKITEGKIKGRVIDVVLNCPARILDFNFNSSGSSRIAAYKMGFDFWGTEIDEEYFNMQEKRFREECLGEVRLKNGNVYKQKELFEL